MSIRVRYSLGISGLLVIGLLLCLGGCRQNPSEPSGTPAEGPSQTTPETAPAEPADSSSQPAPTPAEPAEGDTPSVTPAPAPSSDPLAEGQVLLWERQGGGAGFCDRLVLYADGRAVASSCEDQLSVERGAMALSDEQRNQLNEWLRTLRPFDRTGTDGALVHPMTTRVAFAGTGDTDITEADLGTLAAFATDIYVLAADSARLESEPPAIAEPGSEATVEPIP